MNRIEEWLLNKLEKIEKYQHLRSNLQEYSYIIEKGGEREVVQIQKKKVEGYQLGGLALGASFLISTRRYKMTMNTPIGQVLLDIAIMGGMFLGCTSIGVESALHDLQGVRRVMFVQKDIDYYLFLANKYKQNLLFYKDESRLLTQFMSQKDVDQWQEVNSFSFNNFIHGRVSRSRLETELRESEEMAQFQ